MEIIKFNYKGKNFSEMYEITICTKPNYLADGKRENVEVEICNIWEMMSRELIYYNLKMQLCNLLYSELS